MNALKHSGAREVRVALKDKTREIRLTISDDGKGFEYESGAPDRGLGLVSMRSRLGLVGGVLRIRSAPGQGVIIEALVPRPPSGAPNPDP